LASYKPEFFVERKGQQFILYRGLLDMVHQEGLKSVVTTLVQIPSDLNQNVAIVHASIETEKGNFCGIGDASPKNVSPAMVPHIIRMAETRAKARAMRDAVNIGVVSVEELDANGGGDDSVAEGDTRNGVNGADTVPPKVFATTEQKEELYRLAHLLGDTVDDAFRQRVETTSAATVEASIKARRQRLADLKRQESETAQIEAPAPAQTGSWPVSSNGAAEQSSDESEEDEADEPDPADWEEQTTVSGKSKTGAEVTKQTTKRAVYAQYVSEFAKAKSRRLLTSESALSFKLPKTASAQQMVNSLVEIKLLNMRYDADHADNKAEAAVTAAG
jgi:hypothetical protein